MKRKYFGKKLPLKYSIQWGVFKLLCLINISNKGHYLIYDEIL